MIFSLKCGIKKEDRMYCVLPIYHSTGRKYQEYPFGFEREGERALTPLSLSLTCYESIVIVSCLSALQAGATIVLARKFSAQRFWNDCVDYKVTVFSVSTWKMKSTHSHLSLYFSLSQSVRRWNMSLLAKSTFPPRRTEPSNPTHPWQRLAPWRVE